MHWLRILLCSVALFCCAVASHGAAPAGRQEIGDVKQLVKLNDGVELICGTARVRVLAYADGIVRVRLAPTGEFAKDFSRAVVELSQHSDWRLEDSAGALRLITSRLTVSIKKFPLTVSFLDPAGRVLSAESPARPMSWNGSEVRAWKTMPADEFYYGLGDKAGPMNRRDRAFTMWNTDAYRWQESTDPLYKAIPFFLALREGAAYGIFFDNTWRSSFDFGKESRDFYSFGADGGELDYYFIVGPTPKSVVERFTALVGRTPLPPLWSLGFQQSRWSYDREERVRKIADTFREKKIPADAIYLDIDYQNGNRPFTIDRARFPHFEEMIRDLRAEGFHTVAITDLHIKKEAGYAPYDSGTIQDVFVKNPDGSTYSGSVWPGESVFPDFTLSRVRSWWGSLYKDFVSVGIAGFWNDMNEPSIFLRADKTMPLDVVHRLDDGSSLDHRAVHNIYGLENARATYEGLLELAPNERPFVLTRAAFAGAQRYAATWTGDNSSTWNHLRMSTPMLLSLGISGYPLVGDDIGGFVGSPPADLLTRWIEVGAFNTLFRDHTDKGSADQEPWVHGPEHEAIRRQAIEKRYRLMPYLYTAAEEMSRTGLPIMRPVFLEYPGAADFYAEDREFLFGSDLLVAPVVEETLDAYPVRFPPGGWFDFSTGAFHQGGTAITVRPALAETPLYVRAGAILPEQPVVQNTGEKPQGPLELRVYPGADCRGSLYLDDGETFAYERGESLRLNFSCEVRPDSLSVTTSIANAGFAPWWDELKLVVYGAASSPKEVRLNGRPVHGWAFDQSSHSVTLTFPDHAAAWRVEFVLCPHSGCAGFAAAVSDFFPGKGAGLPATKTA
ncbi:MAG: glycoside hydrolase family 31 protein [Candidatus Acidiferrales bacterium]|jgi:alpha-glucosidase